MNTRFALPQPTQNGSRFQLELVSRSAAVHRE